MAGWVLAAMLFFSTDQQPLSEQRQPLPPGNRIVAEDGDTIVVDHNTRVRIVRSTEANVRAIFNAEEGWLIVLADHAVDGAPDGRVDSTRTYHGVPGQWPLDTRWEGPATLEEYVSVGPDMGPPGFGLRTAHGLVQFLGIWAAEIFRDPEAIAIISSQGSSAGLAVGWTFEEAEKNARSKARQNAAEQRAGSTMRFGSGPVVPSGAVPDGVTTSVTMSATSSGAVRVGGNVAPPTKVHDVPAVAPAEALRAGLRGVVIIEATIDSDGTVKDARVLRSIPMLDAAAVAAVRQWRYTPTLLNGQAVPVIMTVTVPFP